MDTLHITATDDRYTIREALRHADVRHVLLHLPWEVERGWRQRLDYEVVLREIQRRELEAAWVIEDPARRPIAREVGFPVFGSAEAAEVYWEQHERWPAMRPLKPAGPPRNPWWAEPPRRPKLRLPRPQPAWLLMLESIVLIVVLLIVAATGLLVGPSARIILTPEGQRYEKVVPVAVSPDLDVPNLQRGIIPSARIGDEFKAYVEVSTSGQGFAYSGRATGRVLFTNLLGQEYRVAEGTVLRTSSGSYPVRFVTTQEVVIPSFGQIEAPIEALEEGPRGNVDAYQINLVEGVAGFAVRVTNPYPVSGAESATVAVVSEADQARAWDLAADQVMAKAYDGLRAGNYLEPGEYLPHQSLVVQAVPKQAYTHLVGEETPTLGLSLRLLVTAQKVKLRDVHALAYHHLAANLPEGYRLTDARFEYGEAAEEEVGPGQFTFYVAAYGYATSHITPDEIIRLVKGRKAAEAEKMLAEELPLARPPEITVSPEWFPYMPFLDLRYTVEIVPGDMRTP
ncbi:MAG: baseplate J/gp47 family protein [Anaerolineales bacterium]